MEVDKFSLNEAVTGVTDMDNGNLKLAECCLVTFIRVLALAIIPSSSINLMNIFSLLYYDCLLSVCYQLYLIWFGREEDKNKILYSNY